MVSILFFCYSDAIGLTAAIFCALYFAFEKIITNVFRKKENIMFFLGRFLLQKQNTNLNPSTIDVKPANLKNEF